MSEETTRWHKSVGNGAVLVPLLTALLVPSCNKSLHLLQGRNAIKVERGCQMGSEKCSHWNGLWFPRDNRIPLFVQRLPGSWQHRHLGSFGCRDFFFSMIGTDSATEHLKVPVPRALRTRVAAKLSNMYLQKRLNEEKLNEGLRK